jgi:hypothetical protein
MAMHNAPEVLGHYGERDHAVARPPHGPGAPAAGLRTHPLFVALLVLCDGELVYSTKRQPHATKMRIHNTYLGGDEDLAARGAHLHMA